MDAERLIKAGVDQALRDFSKDLARKYGLPTSLFTEYFPRWLIALERYDWDTEIKGRRGWVVWPDAEPLLLGDVFKDEEFMRKYGVSGSTLLLVHQVSYLPEKDAFRQLYRQHGGNDRKLKDFIQNEIWPALAWMGQGK
jgi:hypothetical protein